MLLAASSYSTLISAYRTSEQTSDLVNNLSFALQEMSSSIRTGTAYGCGAGALTSCPVSPTNCFSFVNQDGMATSYLLRYDGTIGRINGGRSCAEGVALAMTDPNVHIDTLDFFVTGAAKGDGLQPRVVFVVSGTIDEKRQGAMVSVRFSLESEVTQRLLDI